MPFVYNTPLSSDSFAGRSKAIDQVTGRLAQHTRSSTCLAGGPLTGKTSLLRYLAQSPTAAGLPGLAGSCRVYFDGFSVGTNMKPAGFWAGVLRSLHGATKGTPLQAVVELKLQDAKAGDIDLYDLEDVFDEFATAALPVVVFIDNFDVLLLNAHFWPPDDFFHIVRALGQREPRGLSFVITTHRQLFDLWDPNKGASPFYNIFLTVPLGVIEPEEIRTFLKRGFTELALEPDVEIVELIVAASDGHPCLLNYIAHLCAQSLKAGQKIDGAQLKDAFVDPAGPVVGLIHQIRSRLTPTEKTLLETLGSKPGTLTDTQRAYARSLRDYGLLPPGLKSKL